MLSKLRLFIAQNKSKLTLGINFILIVTGLTGILLLYRKELVRKVVEISYIERDEIYEQSSGNDEIYYADISGQVVKPGVYRIYRGEIVADLVNKAGGFNDNVNNDYLHKCLNLAENLNNEQKVYVPAKNENFPCQNNQLANSGIDNNEVVSLNSSTKSELETIPGVGPATAESIISSRPYSSIDDVLRVKGIGEKTLEKMRPFISL